MLEMATSSLALHAHPVAGLVLSLSLVEAAPAKVSITAKLLSFE